MSDELPPQCPQQLSPTTAVFFCQLAEHFPHLTDKHTLLIVQASVLYERLLDDPETFTAPQHTQLRQLYQELQTLDKELSPPKMPQAWS